VVSSIILYLSDISWTILSQP